MKKDDLIKGKTYLRKHKATMHSRYGNKEAEAEGYIECMQVTPAGGSILSERKFAEIDG